MTTENRGISLNDDAAQADADDDTPLTDADLGSDGSGEEDTDEEQDRRLDKIEKKLPKKADKKPPAAKEEDDEEEDAEEPEEEEDEDETPAEDPERVKLAKKLARTSAARTRLEQQVAEQRRQLEELTQTKSDATKERMVKLHEELDSLYDAVEDFRAEGKTKEAAKAQRRIDEIRDGMTRAQAAYTATRDALAQTEMRAYNTMVKELETLDERFDPDSDDFDQSLLDDVSELVDGYEKGGMALTEALRKAVKLTLREDLFSKKRALAREDKKREPEKKAAGKKPTDVDKNLRTAKKQPPEEPGARREKSTELPDMETISEKDFDALPESVQRRLLGNDG